ncbi:MAG: hypothetical protein ABL958_03510 [Bdellovibrionia bacterium]
MIRILWTLVLLISSNAIADEACLKYLADNPRGIVEVRVTREAGTARMRSNPITLNENQKILLCRYSNDGAAAVRCMNSIESQIKKMDVFKYKDGTVQTRLVVAQFAVDRWASYATLCSGTTDVPKAAQCVKNVLETVGTFGDGTIMTGIGAATVCANNADFNFAAKCMTEGQTHLVDDSESPPHLTFGLLPDLCITVANNPSIADRITCADPYLKGATGILVRPATKPTRDDTCPVGEPLSGTHKPESLRPEARVNVCAVGGGTERLCCARRLVQLGNCKVTARSQNANEYNEVAYAAGMACQSVSAQAAWGKVLQCLDDGTRKPVRGQCPPDEIHQVNALRCGSGWGITSFLASASQQSQ